MKNNNNIFKFTETKLLEINCPNGYCVFTIYGFMQNYNSFAVHCSCTVGITSLIDVLNQASGLDLLKTRWDSSSKKIHVYSNENVFSGIVIGCFI